MRLKQSPNCSFDSANSPSRTEQNMIEHSGKDAEYECAPPRLKVPAPIARDQRHPKASDRTQSAMFADSLVSKLPLWPADRSAKMAWRPPKCYSTSVDS